MTLTKRLSAAAFLLAEKKKQPGGTLIDIGTDHGYLPLFLIENGTFSKAVAADINEGPLNAAKKNFALSGKSSRAEFILSDGLEKIAVPAAPFSVSVCGMGGELIAGILGGKNDFYTAESFVLQPMTRPEVLREFLVREGFETEKELHVKEDGKIYTLIRAVYTGKEAFFSAEELFFGKTGVKERNTDTLEFFLHEKAVLEKIASGKRKAGIDISRERSLIEYAEKEAAKIMRHSAE